MARLSAEERRQQLVRAAIEVMGEEGLDAATTRRIAEQADVPLGTVHHVFENKRELLRAVVESVTGDVAAALDEVISPAHGLARAVEDSVRGFWRMVEGAPGAQLMRYELTTYAIRRPELAWLAEWQCQRYCSVVETAYRRARRPDETPVMPLPQLARLVVAATDGIVVQYLAHGNTRRARQDVRNLVQAVRGLVRTDAG
ncbi:transcriptional regulator, TetR family [Streptoalloteichus tenebrarius]|uniref:Transcriptional regulator, TetR family n=1 Tax=Streptoalloteichus tenebrarius (strain ATCC 17920 / DSM 40477 / JCM 4838 / CBS 697.72 / NBRC 16177 / NCIMB 11028 / NRRL B-12390 / A12253. 1 / ISP 5477) TaxID=1933 RepID=A0ABT1HZD6_STRSD|nr:TetR/AcrR family transcriptional regulator [Streptoalloteichus tenebrarius]MCP2260720.1 transcriptional regulator, TetR family [Streptoalloteichus tenebrarius]BFF03746.1 TetR family transcriptional regulator [Streptoalloteichus tenebrarius]